MENINDSNKKKNNKNRLLLPLELLFDIIRSANKSLDLKNYGNKAMILELKEYFIKLMSCSTILYAYFGENLIKLYRKLK
nr:unnamed protein product [Meloidogyne enterolobii]